MVQEGVLAFLLLVAVVAVVAEAHCSFLEVAGWEEAILFSASAEPLVVLPGIFEWEYLFKNILFIDIMMLLPILYL